MLSRLILWDNLAVELADFYQSVANVGDQINAILTGVGHNLRLILNHIRKLLKLGKLGKFLAQILLHLLEIFCQKLISLENVENGKWVL